MCIFSDFAKDLLNVLVSLKDMLLDKDVSAVGRDNAISLIAKNIPRRDIRYGNNARTMTFLEMGGNMVNNCLITAAAIDRLLFVSFFIGMSGELEACLFLITRQFAAAIAP